MAELAVIEAGFFIRTEPSFGPSVEPGFEYRVWGRVLVELAGAGDHGPWRQQGVVEGRLDWPLYDWTLAISRSARTDFRGAILEDEWEAWEAPDEPERPLTTRDRRDAVALALHRTRSYIAQINTARL